MKTSKDKNIEKDNKKNDKSINNDEKFKILVYIFILVTIVLVLFLISNKRKLSNTSDAVVEVYNYFNTEDLNNCEGLFNYSDRIVKNEDIKIDTKLCVAYQKAELKLEQVKDVKKDKEKDTCTYEGMTFRLDSESKKCDVGRVKANIIDDNYNKIFGGKVEDIESFMSDNTHICYLKDNYYYCGLSVTYTLVLEGNSNIYRTIDKAEEKSGDMIVYDYFMRINDSNCYRYYTTPTINTECNDNLMDRDNIKVNFMKKYGTKYKHVYKKGSNNTYYWVSSEPVR